MPRACECSRIGRSSDVGAAVTLGAVRQLRDYQEYSIGAWNQNDNRGILAMATGTGKTLTALEAVDRFRRANPHIKLVLFVAPFQHLADQWVDELASRGISALRAYESQARWKAEWARERHKANALRRAMYVVTTYTTLGTETLQSHIAPVAAGTVLVADECHYMGSPRVRAFWDLPVAYRLGLSATPERHFDDAGTRSLIRYFGGIVYSFGMREAIERGFLTPYNYYPEAVELGDEEFEEYRELTTRIGRAMASTSSGSEDDDEAIKRLLQRRSRLLNNAHAKVDWLRQKLVRRTPQTLRYTLVYVGDVLFDEVMAMIGSELQIPSHAFTSRQTRAERAAILKRFQAGELSVLVAMRCLDEGVDVPPTRTAYFLASTSNPREFVQRRGRILRRSPGKRLATIFDSISIPPLGESRARFDPAERAALKSQFSRIQEFGQQAHNAIEADAATFKLRMAADLPAYEPAGGDSV